MMVAHPGGRMWRPLGWRSDALGLLALAQSLCLLAGSGRSEGQQLLAILGTTLLGAVLLVWLAREPRFEALPVAWVMALAVAVRALAGLAQPLLEDDHFRYLWDGYQTLTTGTPYGRAPEAWFATPELPARWQDVLSGINNPEVPTIYGPVLQAGFALATWIGPARLGVLQLLWLGLDLLVLVLLHRAGTPRRWLLAYAIHPLVLKESLASAHPDFLIGLLVLAAWLAWRRGGAGRAGAVLGLALATKVSVAVVLPFFLLRPTVARHSALAWAARCLAVAVGVAAACYLPFLLQGGSDSAGLATFAQRWRFNPLLYRGIEALLPAPWDRYAAAVLLATGLALLAWRRRGQDLPLDLAFTALVLCAPVANPWYALWGLALGVALQRVSTVALGLLLTLAYINGPAATELGWLQHGAAFSVPWPVTVLELLGLFALWWRYDRRDRHARPGQHAPAPAATG